MQRYTLRGNSLPRGIRVEDMRVISRGGAKIHEVIYEAKKARRSGTTFFLLGVPDLWVKGHSRINREKVRPLKETIAKTRGKRQWVLGSIFSPKNASQREMSTICLMS